MTEIHTVRDGVHFEVHGERVEVYVQSGDDTACAGSFFRGGIINTREAAELIAQAYRKGHSDGIHNAAVIAEQFAGEYQSRIHAHINATLAEEVSREQI